MLEDCVINSWRLLNASLLDSTKTDFLIVSDINKPLMCFFQLCKMLFCESAMSLCSQIHDLEAIIEPLDSEN